MSRNHRDWDLECKVYVGNLTRNASQYEIEDAFAKYGPLKNVWVARNPPGFAFVEFEDPRDAEDAVRGLDNTKMCGTRVRVEMSSGKSRRGGRFGGGGGRGGRDRDRDRDYSYGRRSPGYDRYSRRSSSCGARRRTASLRKNTTLPASPHSRPSTSSPSSSTFFPAAAG